MTNPKHLRYGILLLLTALLLSACEGLEVGIEPTPTPPTTPAAAPLVTVLVTREVTVAPSPTATRTPRATRPLTRAPSPTRTSIPTLTPMPTYTPSPTVCAEARVSGRVCTAGTKVTLSSCCPEWAAHTNADTQGYFAFPALTAGTFTVSGGGHSQVVVLETCYSEVTVDLCPPAPTPGPTCPPEAIEITIRRVDVNDYQVTINGVIPWSCSPPQLEWDWGDGWSDEQGLPATHTYATGGTYPIVLTVRNDTGQTATWTTSVYVGAYVGPMVRVPAGTFPMGCDDGNPTEECDANTQPVHTVYLDAYYIDLYEVTNGRYRDCVQAGACAAPSPGSSATRTYYYGNYRYDGYPVLNVSWQDAANYCAWAGKRLPTEAEWEKAARGTSGAYVFPWGNATPTCSRANHKVAAGPCVGDTAPVGYYGSGASPYGVMDMAGSVWEWVSDWYGEDYYSNSPYRNPTGPAEGTEKVVRGGSWFEEARWIHTTVRISDLPTERYNRLGFRCARGE